MKVCVRLSNSACNFHDCLPQCLAQSPVYMLRTPFEMPPLLVALLAPTQAPSKMLPLSDPGIGNEMVRWQGDSVSGRWYIPETEALCLIAGEWMWDVTFKGHCSSRNGNWEEAGTEEFTEFCPGRLRLYTSASMKHGMLAWFVGK